jgi:hypothetical protein
MMHLDIAARGGERVRTVAPMAVSATAMGVSDAVQLTTRNPTW